MKSKAVTLQMKALDEYPSNREVHIVAEYNFTIFAIYFNIQGAAIKGLNLFFFF